MNRRELQMSEESTPPGLAKLLFAIDVRALAALRIGLGFLILWDVLHILPHAREFLSADGMVVWNPLSPAKSSVFLLGGGGVAYARAVLSVYGALALMLIVGFHTRLVTAGCLVLAWSLISASPLIAPSGDHLAIWLLIWSLFLPIGA